MFKGNYAINTFGVKMRSSVENYSKVLDKIIKNMDASFQFV